MIGLTDQLNDQLTDEMIVAPPMDITLLGLQLLQAGGRSLLLNNGGRWGLLLGQVISSDHSRELCLLQ